MHRSLGRVLCLCQHKVKSKGSESQLIHIMDNFYCICYCWSWELFGVTSHSEANFLAYVPSCEAPFFLHASPLNPRRIPMRHKKWTVSWYNWNNSVRTACVQKNLPIFSPLSSYITMFAVVLDTSSHFLIFKLQLGHFIIFNSGASVILYLQFMQMWSS